MSPLRSSEKKLLPAFESNACKELERVPHQIQNAFGDVSSNAHGPACNEAMKCIDDATETRTTKTASPSIRLGLPSTPAEDGHLKEQAQEQGKVGQPIDEAMAIDDSDSKAEYEKSKTISSPSERRNNTKIENEQEATKDICLPSTVGVLSTVQRIFNPEPADVLFGRGKPYQGHSGNQKLREIVDKYKDAYMGSRRYDKLAIAEEIVKGVQGGRWGEAGRFLRRADNGEDFWVVAADEEAREKVSHALRGKKKTIGAPHSETKKDSRISGPAEEVLHSPGKHFPRVLEITDQEQATGGCGLTAAELLLLRRGTPLGATGHDPGRLLVPRIDGTNSRPGGAGGLGILSTLELQNLLLSSHHQNQQQQQQQLLQQQMALIGGDTGRPLPDLSLMGNQNALLASQLGLFGAADNNPSVPPSFLSQYQQYSLAHQAMNPSAAVIGRSQSTLGIGGHPSQISPLVSALLGQRSGQIGMRGQEHSTPTSSANIGEVWRELQQARDQNALADYILRNRGGHGPFGGNSSQK